jgi:O-antigen/teichoic acid export membrane protein/glycosyltransferase involved in cell wall biosynthesis
MPETAGTPPVLVSIITVCLNAEMHLREAMDSVLAQTYADIEYIVVDGGSSDATLEIIKEYELRFGGRMRWTSGPDSGLYDAMNKGVASARGDLIGILNADDLYPTDAVKLAVETWRANPEAGIVFGDTCNIDESGNVTLDRPAPPEITREVMMRGMMVCHQSMFVSADTYRQQGAYDTQYRILADYEFVMRCIRAGVGFASTGALLSSFRLGGVSGSFDRQFDRELSLIRIRYGANPLGQWALYYKHALSIFAFGILGRSERFVRLYDKHKARKIADAVATRAAGAVKDTQAQVDLNLVGKRRLFTNTAANGLAQAVSVLTTFLFLPLLMRAFGVANYGLYLLAASASAYAYLLDFGIGVVLIRRVSERLAVGERERVPGLLLSAAMLYSVIGVLAAVLLVVVGRFAGIIFNVTATEALLLERLLWIAAALQLWYWPASTARHALAGMQHYRFLAATSSLGQLGGAAATIAVLVAGQGPLVLALASGGVMISASLAEVWFLRRQMRGFGRPPRPALSTMRSLVDEGLPIFGIQVADMVMKQQTDRLVLGVYLGAAAVAVYEVAAKLSALISQASTILVSALLPVASSLSAQQRHASVNSLFLRGSKYITLVLSPLIVVATVLAGAFITVWLGPDFGASIPVARALMLAQFFVPLYVVGDSILIGKNRFSQWLPFSVFLAFVNLGLSIVLVLRFGLIGVALGTVAACLLEFPLYGRMVLRELKITTAKWLSNATLPAYPLLFIPVAISVAALYTPLTESLLGVIATGIVALAAYWGAAYFMALSAQERAKVRDLIRSFTTRSASKEADPTS